MKSVYETKPMFLKDDYNSEQLRLVWPAWDTWDWIFRSPVLCIWSQTPKGSSTKSWKILLTI